MTGARVVCAWARASLLLVAAAAVCDGAKILAVLPIFAKSHHYVMQPVIRELAERGHEITFYTPILLGKNYTNVKQIEVHLPIEKMIGEVSFTDLRQLGEIPIVNFISFWVFGLGTVDSALTHPEYVKLIHSKDHYDLVILETHFGQESLIALGHKFNAPVVSLATFTTFTFIDEFLGNPFATSYIPGFELPYDLEMTFLQRCHNAVRVVSTLLVGYYMYLPVHDSYMRKNFNYSGSESMPPLVDMLQETALVILNSQIAVDYPRPLVPNVIGVAGLHITPQNKPLPKDLKDFMDNSKNGVIYVSFGSFVPADRMPVEMRNAFINAFGKLKQNVLWKLPIDSLEGLPKNIKLSKWLPQQDILAHPNVKAFITHGGLLSQEESVYYGVPLVGVPFFGDQHMNIKRAAHYGFAVYLDSFNISEVSVGWAVNEILSNPNYREKVKLYSKIFRDNPERPIDKAMYWIEYIIRYKGAPHLRSPARKLPHFKYLLLDVAAFLGLLLFIVLFSIYLLFKCLVSLCCKKKPQQVKSSKKKN